VQATAMAKTVCPAGLVVEVQILETEIECRNYLDNHFVELFSFVGTFSHFFPFSPLCEFYTFDSYDVSSKNSSALGKEGRLHGRKNGASVTECLMLRCTVFSGDPERQAERQNDPKPIKRIEYCDPQ
jgi:hypothetical protein